MEARAEAIVRGRTPPVPAAAASGRTPSATSWPTTSLTAPDCTRTPGRSGCCEARGPAGGRRPAGGRDAAPGRGRTRRRQRRPNRRGGSPAAIATELHTRVVAARLELAAGRRSAGLAHVRRGLDELAAYQARFGSQDLQSASAVHGRDLTRLGLRTALQTRSPAAILQWLERSRAASTRLAAVRPSADGVLAEELSQLRMASYRARLALLAGAADPRPGGEVEPACGAGCGPAPGSPGGSGAVNRPLPLAAVQRALAASGSGISVVAPFRGNGRFHALVITATVAAHLGRGSGFRARARCCSGSSAISMCWPTTAILGPLRRVAAARCGPGCAPGRRAPSSPRIQQFADDGPVIVAAAGSAAIVPWALLPGLSGRAVSVSPSVTAAVAGLGATRACPARGAGGRRTRRCRTAPAEAERVAGVHYRRGPPHRRCSPAPRRPVGRCWTRSRRAACCTSRPTAITSRTTRCSPACCWPTVCSTATTSRRTRRCRRRWCCPAVTSAAPTTARVANRSAWSPPCCAAGCPTVVAGTSRVSDEVAAAVMAAYHQRLSIGQTAGDRAGRGDRRGRRRGRRSGAVHLFRGRAVTVRGRPDQLGRSPHGYRAVAATSSTTVVASDHAESAATTIPSGA